MTKKKEYSKDDDAPSERFVDSLCGYGVGSPDLTCGWCDRVHLCPTSESYAGDEDGGKGWKEDCVGQHKETPEGEFVQCTNSIAFFLSTNVLATAYQGMKSLSEQRKIQFVNT